MKLAMRARSTYKRVTLFTAAFVLAISTLTAAAPFVLNRTVAAMGENTVNNIATYTDLKAALDNDSVGYINLAADVTIETPEELVLSRSDVRINGNDSTIKYVGAGSGVNGTWDGTYVFQAYNVSNVEINSLRVSNADAGFLINGSQVTLKGNTHALNNEFGGIEVSKGSASSNSVLTLQGNLWDESNLEANGKPAVWVVNGQGSVVTTNLNSPLTAATHVKSGPIGVGQTQYYLRAANTLTVATNTTQNQTYATLQAAFDAANENDTVVLNKNTTVAVGAVANLISKKITFDGQGNTIETLGDRGLAGDQKNAGLIVESTADGTTVKNLTVKGIGGLTARHGLIVHEANGTLLQNITAVNNAGGVMINASTATIDTINTSGNAWYGVNVDKTGAVLTIKGVNTHNEIFPIYVDYRTVGVVNDVEKRYDIVADSRVGKEAADGYVIDTTAPSISWQVQPASLVKDSFVVRPITSEVGTLKSIYFDVVSPATLCKTLNSDHKNFDTSQASCPTVFANLTDGTHKFVAVFSDANGNRTESSSTNFVLDRKGPTVTVQPSSIGVNGVYTKIGFNFFDTNKVDKITINGATKELTNSNYSNVDNIGSPYWYGAIEGTNTLIAYDVAGNASAPVTFKIDRTGPTASSITSPTGWTLGASNVTWSASTDLNGPVTYTLIRSSTPNIAADGVALVSNTTATSFTYDLPIGPQWLQVIAKDSVGNTTVGPTQGVQVIGVPEVVTPFAGQVLNQTNGNSFVTKWTAVHGIGGVQSYEIRYGVDRNNNGTFEANEYAIRSVSGSELERIQQFTTDFQGNLSVQVRAVYSIAFSPNDPMSNRGPWSQTVLYSRDTVVNVDTTVRATPYTSATPIIEGTVDANATTLAATINGSPYDVVKNGAAWTITVPSNKALDNGSYELIVTAKDAAGNTQESKTTVNVAVAQVTPQVPAGGDGGNTDGPDTAPGTLLTTDPQANATGPVANPANGLGTPQVLGQSTANDAINQSNQGTPEVEGASTQNTVAQAVTNDENEGRLFGLAWYWWILIIAALAALAWWIIAAARRRNQEN